MQYYKAMASQMDPEEIERLKNKCSKHREVCKIDLNNTPEGQFLSFGSPFFMQTFNCVCSNVCTIQDQA